MKKSELVAIIKECINEAHPTGKKYWVLPTKIIGNDLHRIKDTTSRIYSNAAKGNDFDKYEVEDLIRALQKIADSAIEVPAGEPHPRGYGTD